jgi:hypothetical protein
MAIRRIFFSEHLEKKIIRSEVSDSGGESWTEYMGFTL